MPLRSALLLLFGLLATVMPARADAITDAVNDAAAALSAARPHLGAQALGVDIAAYADALSLGRFTSHHWGRQITLDLVESDTSTGACARFAAFVDLPPQGSRIGLTICPQFSREGSPALRRLTVLHEMVHVVAGPDECRAMAFAARVEQLATGAHTPVDRYWRANDCAGSGFSLP